MIVPLTSHKLQTELIEGATAPIQGWVSFFSGEKLPAPTLCYRCEAVAPVQFCTVLYPYANGKTAPVVLSPLAVEVEGRSQADNGVTGLRLEMAAHVDYLVLDRSAATRRKTFAGYETEGPLAYIRCKKANNQPIKVILSGG
jgi:hypothetical protein